MSEVLTPEYFREQMREFDKMKGNKEYWKLSADGKNTKIELAFKGLIHIYLRIEGLTEDDRRYIQTIVQEFAQCFAARSINSYHFRQPFVVQVHKRVKCRIVASNQHSVVEALL